MTVDLTKWDPADGSRYIVDINIELGTVDGGGENDDRDWELNPRHPHERIFHQLLDELAGQTLRDLLQDYAFMDGANLRLTVYDNKARPGITSLTGRLWWNGIRWTKGVV